MSQRIAVVTGANRGIGLELCRQLAQHDIRVILTSRDEKRGRAALEGLEKAGFQLDIHPLDVTDSDRIRRLKEYVARTYGRLDILVNNAALYIDRRHSLLELEEEVLRRTMETNAYGPLMLTQAFVPLMKKNGYGRIVNLSSGLGELSDLAAAGLPTVYPRSCSTSRPGSSPANCGVPMF